MYQPLADELRPTTLDDVYGQEEILGEGRMLRRMIESGRVPNLSTVMISAMPLAAEARMSSALPKACFSERRP